MSKFIKEDRFGNPYQVVGCKDKKGSGYSAGFIELGGKMYKVEPSEAQKDGVMYWVKVTLMKKKKSYTNM